MRYGKTVGNGYIIAIGIGLGGEEITEEEYLEIKATMQSRPQPTSTIDYRLAESLEWEPFELEIEEPSDEDELSDEEAMAIIMGDSE